MNLFIDTNTYLEFYQFGKDALEELKKLSVALKKRKITLFVPFQLLNEFKKHRETRISSALKRLRDQKMPSEFPQICRTYEEFHEMKRSIEQFEKARNKILDRLNDDIENNCLDADKLIADLFENANAIEFSERILSRADQRVKLGSPPGKSNSWGDAINWECLLCSVPNGEDCHLVSRDGDFVSEVNPNRLKQFLLEEWQHEKKSQLFYFPWIGAFFQEKFPDIKLAEELEKRMAIEDLTNSYNFNTTHRAIQSINKFADFSAEEVAELLEAALSNSQIHLIKRDADVKSFFTNLAKSNQRIIDQNLFSRFSNVYMPEEIIDSDEKI